MRNLKIKSEQYNFIINNHSKIQKKITKDIITQNTVKKRNPGVDLVRLIGAYIIVLNHFLFIGRGLKKYSKYQKQLNFLHIFTDWDNNGFALISGIVGYKTNKYANLLYLWLTVFFYSVGIHLFIIIFKKSWIIKDPISIEFYPIIFKRYWYFTAYFGMYLFLPVINKGISVLSKFEYKLVILSTLGILVFWRDFKNPNKDVFAMKEGKSIIWLLTYYLTGVYIGKYRVNYTGFKNYIYCLLCIFIYFFSSYLYYKISYNDLNLGQGHLQKELLSLLKKMLNKRFDSYMKIAQSLTVCLFFLQINYNKFIAKIICFLGPLVFGVYLIHIHPLSIINFLIHVFDKDSRNLSLISTMNLVLMKSLKTFIICLIIDYFRNTLLSLLRFKRIFIMLETKMFQILG